MIDFNKRAVALIQIGSDLQLSLEEIQARIAVKLQRWYEKDQRRIAEHCVKVEEGAGAQVAGRLE